MAAVDAYDTLGKGLLMPDTDAYNLASSGDFAFGVASISQYDFDTIKVFQGFQRVDGTKYYVDLYLSNYLSSKVLLESAYYYDQNHNLTLSYYNINVLVDKNAINSSNVFIENLLSGNDTINGNKYDDILRGGSGSDTLNGGSNVDTAIVSGLRAAYTVTQTSTGVWSVNGPDGTDTLSNIEYLKFDDETLRLLPGTGTSVNFLADSPGTYMSGIRDFDGNDLGASSGWKRIGAVDVNGDGDLDQILVNRTNGRFAEVGTAADGKVYFNDYGWAGETRVVGIYIDPLVQSGEVTSGGPNDSQRRFQNDLNIENISRVLGSADYDNDGLQEVYFALTDGTAYLHAYMHADGNIQYANYQSQQQVSDYLANNGWDASTASGWFG